MAFCPRKKQIACAVCLLILLVMYFDVPYAMKWDPYHTTTHHSPSAQSMFHPLDIDRLLKPTADDEIVMNNEEKFFVLLLTRIRRMYHFDQPKCRSNVHFALLMIDLNKHFPAYFNHFLSTAARNPSIDIFIFASTNDCTELQTQYRDTNVYVMCIHRELLYFFITDGLCSEWKCNMQEFYKTFRHIKSKLIVHPSRVLDLRPMFGSFFGEYLSCYSHWAFGEADVWLGNFDKLYPAALARDFDIITFPYGDDHTIFMRGQLTVLKKTRSIVSLWTHMERFSSCKAFSNMVDTKKWSIKTIIEGNFSTVIVDSRDVTWIQLPGFQVQDEYLAPFKVEVSVSTDQPPSLIVQRSDDSDGENSYTKLNWSHLSNMKEVTLLKEKACQTQTWMSSAVRRCIKSIKTLSERHGTVIMRSRVQTKVLTKTVAIGMKEYLLFNFRRSRKTFNWSVIPLNNVFRIDLVDALKKKDD